MGRRVGLFLVVGFVLPLVVAASASAQGSILRLSPQTASPGEAVTAFAPSGYSAGTGISDVSIRLSTRSGQVLRTTSPDTAGGINTTFPVPAGLSPGTYLILATQTTTNGRQRAFTPGRAKLVVRAAAAGADAAPAGSQGGSTSPLAISAMILALILLLAAASALLARRLRTDRPHLGS